MMGSLAGLPKGHTFPPVTFDLSPAWAGSYVQAVEDRAISSLDAVPPMAITALSIRSLLESASLPAGAVHLGQEMTFHHPVRPGDRLTVCAAVASRGERQGWVLMAVDLSVSGTDGAPVMSGRATLTFPQGGEQDG